MFQLHHLHVCVLSRPTLIPVARATRDHTGTVQHNRATASDVGRVRSLCLWSQKEKPKESA